VQPVRSVYSVLAKVTCADAAGSHLYTSATNANEIENRLLDELSEHGYRIVLIFKYCYWPLTLYAACVYIITVA